MTLVIATFTMTTWAHEDSDVDEDGVVLGCIGIGDPIIIFDIPRFSPWVTCFTKFGICQIHEVHFRKIRGIFKHPRL